MTARSKKISTNRHIKVHVLYGAMWLPYIYISHLYKILVIFVVINDYRCVAHCGPSIDRQFIFHCYRSSSSYALYSE